MDAPHILSSCCTGRNCHPPPLRIWFAILANPTSFLHPAPLPLAMNPLLQLPLPLRAAQSPLAAHPQVRPTTKRQLKMCEKAHRPPASRPRKDRQWEVPLRKKGAQLEESRAHRRRLERLVTDRPLPKAMTTLKVSYILTSRTCFQVQEYHMAWCYDASRVHYNGGASVFQDGTFL